jgi:hypothetical protein
MNSEYGFSRQIFHGIIMIDQFLEGNCMSYPPDKIDYSRIPENIRKKIEEQSGPGKTAITFWGANTLMISEDDAFIMIDPYFSRVSFKRLDVRSIGDRSDHVEPVPQRISQCLDYSKVSCPDAIIFTHSHIDHILDMVEIVLYYKKKGYQPIIYGSSSAANVLLGKLASPEQIDTLSKLKGDEKTKYFHLLCDGFNFKIVSSGSTITLKKIKMTFIEGTHVNIPFVNDLLNGSIEEPLTDPHNVYDYKQGLLFKILMESCSSGKTLLMGSAGYKDHEFNDYIKNYGSPDNIVVAIAGLARNIETKNFVENVITPLNAKTVYFTHWEDYRKPLDEKVEWAMWTNPELIIEKVTTGKMLPILRKTYLQNI